MKKLLNGLVDAGTGLIRTFINIVVGFSKRTLRKRYRVILAISILATILVPAWCLCYGYASQGGANSAEWEAVATYAFLILLGWTGFYSLRVVIFFAGIGKVVDMLPHLGKLPAISAMPAKKK